MPPGTTTWQSAVIWYSALAPSLRKGTLVAMLAAFLSPVLAQQNEEAAVLLRTIQALESLRYEIIQERSRFNATPEPTDEAELQTWRAIAQDMSLTLAEIELAIGSYQKRYRKVAGSAASPPASDMPPLLPE